MKSLNPVTIPLKAINLIEASAGTGKTYAITSLYIRLLLQSGRDNFSQPLTVEQILVVTFTEMATQELKERIRTRIYETRELLIEYRDKKEKSIFEKDDFLYELVEYIDDIDLAIHRLNLAEQNFDLAAIYTIHSFCRKVLMQYAFNSGIHFNLELVTDESELLQQLTNEFWRKHFYHQPLEITSFIYKELVSPAQLLNKIRHYLSKQSLILPKQEREHINLSFAEFLSKDLQTTLNAVKNFKENWLNNEVELRALFDKNKANISRYRDDWIDGRFNKIRSWALDKNNASYPDELQKYFSSEGIQKQMKKNQSPFEYSIFSQVDEFVDNLIPTFTKNKSLFLYYCIQEIKQTLFNYKLTHSQKGFDDLLHLVQQALYQEQGEALAQLIRDQYPFAMIDEFQDTDITQYAIFSKIYIQAPKQESGFVMIGDPKQSIYKFRGADIFTYLKAAEEATNQFTLEKNWRSSQELIDCVNGLFDFKENAPFIYEEIQFLPVTAGREQPKFIYQDNPEPAFRFYLSEQPKESQFAEICANSIKNWLENAGENRAIIGDKPIQAKNIAILVCNAHQAELVKNALMARGIASVYLSDRSNVFDSKTAQELALILRACLNPFNERNILNAVATSLFNLTTQAIYSIKENESKWELWVEKFTEYQKKWQHKGILVMLHHLLDNENISRTLLATKNGERKLTDFLHLTEVLQQASRLNETDAALLHWFEKQISGEARLEEQIRLESDRSLVKVVTYHKSKGLAYDLVWLPFIGLPSKRSRGTINTYYDKDEQKVLWDFNDQHSDLIDKENYAEEMRLLYVALTRAKYQVLMILPKTFEKWNALLYTLTNGHIGLSEKLNDKQDSQSLINQLQDSVGHHQILCETIDPLALLQENSKITEKTTALETLSTADFNGEIERDWTVTSFTEMTYIDSRKKAYYVSKSAVENQSILDEAKDYDTANFLSADKSANKIVLTEFNENNAERNTVLFDYPEGYSPFDFPYGTQIGSILHHYLENLHFSQEITNQSVEKLCEQLQLNADWVEPTKQWINNILNTPLIDDNNHFCFADLLEKYCLKELQFYLKIRDHFDVSTFNRLLKQYHHLPSDILMIDEIKGMLRGFIDLVFMQNGQYYIVDYKSNFLGDKMEDYQIDNLKKVMTNQHYDWQYLLYTVALHRYLQQRDPNYQYETHFGGVIYTFLRGMNGIDTTGIYFDKPDVALINELEKLF
ncbi:exodeoxyribonuclease V subunit beta [Bisgaardia hudsonensis]|nr:exodeoxyribonuclease V subunit beta [Bisgaardia hudsonensis]